MIQLTVYGKAQPAGSKRGFKAKDGGVLIVDANPKSRDWKNAVSSEAAKLQLRELLDGPLAVRFVFYAPRPKGHFGTGRSIGILKATAPAYPTGRPDALKLSRAVEDALTGVVWRDDSQIVDECIAKRYGEPARVEITVAPVAEGIELAELAVVPGEARRLF